VRGISWYTLLVIMYGSWVVTDMLGWKDWAAMCLWFAIGLTLAKVMDMEMFAHTCRIVAPGMNSTVNNATPLDVVELPGVSEENGIRKFAVFALGGTHWFSGVGGKSSGYLAAPLDCIETFEGELANVIVNCDVDVYRDNPDRDRHELDLKMLPDDVIRVVKKHCGGRLRGGAVYFGWFPWQHKLGDLCEQRDLAEINKVLEAQNEGQRDEIERLLDRITQYSMTDRHLQDTYGPKPKVPFLKDDRGDRNE